MLTELTKYVNKASFLDATDSSEALLSSGRKLLDQVLGGGLPCGEISEWGIPWKSDGRSVLLFMLAERHRKFPQEPFLWVYGDTERRIYPPAWAARGLDLQQTYFVKTDNPLKDLRPVFLEPTFRVIVLDEMRCLKSDDLAFIQRKARAHKQFIIVIRRYALSARRGNVWAKTRVNCWRGQKSSGYLLQTVKGLPMRSVYFSLEKEKYGSEPGYFTTGLW